MGQQQLLLVILVTILVGIATVIAINIFGSAFENSNRDAVRQDLLHGASSAQAVWLKPTMLGGAGQDFREAENNIGEAAFIRLLGMPLEFDGAEAIIGTNENGEYDVLTREETLLRIRALPSTADAGAFIYSVVCRDANQNWQIAVGEENDTNPCAVG